MEQKKKYPNPDDFETEDEWFDACMKIRTPVTFSQPVQTQNIRGEEQKETQEGSDFDKFKDFRNEVSNLWQTWIARHYNDGMNDAEKKLINRFIDELSEILTKFK
jgi:hypothetical protein